MANPKISIILPCFNGAEMLGGAIESILTQTFPDWELIIVNDCSTDNTLNIAQLYAARDERIRVFSNKVNSKLPASLNCGFDEARGEYWTWTSDDNLLLPTMLETMNAYLDDHPQIGFVAADEYHIDVDGKIIGVSKKPDNIADLLPLNNYVGAAFLYRKEVAMKVGKYRTDLFLVEDYEYWLRMSFNTEMGHLPSILYKYRVHNKSLTATRRQEIMDRLLHMRLQYLSQIENRLCAKPHQLRLFYYHIVDAMTKRMKWKYYWQFARKLPFSFGMCYVFVHQPHKLLRK